MTGRWKTVAGFPTGREKKLKRKTLLLRVLCNLDTTIAAAALVVLICITFAGVIMRYILAKPFDWEEEVQLSLIVWVVFFADVMLSLPKPPAIDMIVNKFPQKLQKATSVTITAVR